MAEHEIKHILVTGAAGFIGFFLSRSLLARGLKVTGIDNLNDYSAPPKEARLRELAGEFFFTFIRMDLADRPGMVEFFGLTNLTRWLITPPRLR